MNIYVGDESGSDDKYPGSLFKAFYSSNALSSNTIRSIYNKQKHQVIKYYKKYLEPKIKKSNKPICKPKQNIFNNMWYVWAWLFVGMTLFFLHS